MFPAFCGARAGACLMSTLDQQWGGLWGSLFIRVERRESASASLGRRRRGGGMEVELEGGRFARRGYTFVSQVSSRCCRGLTRTVVKSAAALSFTV